MRREMRPHIISVVAIVTYLAHFWVQPPAGIALWAVSAVSARRWMPDSAVIIGCIILLGVTLSAIFLLAPQMIQTG